MKLAIVCVLLMLGLVRCEEDNKESEPERNNGEVDMYCREQPPTIDGSCSETNIWTFDYDKGQCVQMEGCFEEAGPEYNMFTSELGCENWCKG